MAVSAKVIIQSMNALVVLAHANMKYNLDYVDSKNMKWYVYGINGKILVTNSIFSTSS